MTDSVRTEDGNVQPSVDPSKPESLDSLAAQAAALDGGAPAAPGQPAGAEVQEVPAATEADVVDLLIMGREMAAPALAEAGVLREEQVLSIWNDKVLTRIARPLVAIMNRHGVGMGEAFEKWGPYVMLLAGIAGPGFATFRAVRLNAVEAKAAQDASQKQQ